MRCAFAMLMFVACGTHGTDQRTAVAAPDPSAGRAPAGDGGATAPSTSPNTVPTPKARRAIEAPHGGSIVTLAATAEGDAVISCDELGGVRLWPALDGTVEPRVVDLPHPKELALGKDPKGFVVALLDDVGGVVVEVVDKDGLAHSRASLAPDPAFLGLAMSSKGLLAWRADQMIVRLAPSGAIADQIPVEAGQRLASVTAEGDRALALIERNGKRELRWLQLAPKLAWGTWIAAGPEIGDTIALSPDGKRVAYLTGAPGALIATVWAIGGGKLVAEAANDAQGIGFIDDDHVAVGLASAVQWIDLSKAKPKPAASKQEPAIPNADTHGAFAVGGGHAIGVWTGELLLATPTTTQYLGYELETPAVVAAAPNAQLLIGVADTFAMLDGQLRESSSPHISVPAGSAITELHWLAGDDWLVESSSTATGVTAIALVDIAHDKSQVVRNGLPMVQSLMYEPATQLATFSLGDSPQVLKYDAKSHHLERVSVLPKPTGYEQAELVPTVPSLASGAQLVAVHMRDRLTLRWIKDAKALDQAKQLTVDGSLASVDAAGHAFVWQNTPSGPLEIAIFRDGAKTGTLPTDGPTALWPDPAGARVVAVGQHSVSLVGLDGKAKWAQPLQGVTEALWLDDKTIAIVSSAGLARVDAATGNVIAARCGWKFGLASRQHPASPRVEPVCAQLQ